MGDWLSIYWVAPVAAWLGAQIVKVVLAGARGEWRGKRPTLLTSGNMPSSHSAITFSMVTAVAIQDGLNTPAFGVAFVLTSIVIYDSLNLRRAVGEQGEVLKGLTKTPFYGAVGHTPTEVLVGALLGTMVAIGLLQIL
jgi:acid phosphatase family membrane protein YuiD